MNKKITVLGGDTRQLHTAEHLSEKGFDVTVFGFELFDGEPGLKTAKDITEAMNSEVIVLPLPCSRNGKTLAAPFAGQEYELDYILRRTRPGTVFFAGMAPAQLENAVRAAGGSLYDYFKREELTLKNALLTAEGVLSILLDKLPITVFGMKAAITGYGRVAFYTARALDALGADVTVFARSPVQLAKAENFGLKAVALKDFAAAERRFDCLVNTVPARIAGENELLRLNRDCLLLETAGAPFGIDKEAASRLGFTLIKAQSLPGKTAPESAGKIIADTLEAMIKEVYD